MPNCWRGVFFNLLKNYGWEIICQTVGDADISLCLIRVWHWSFSCLVRFFVRLAGLFIRLAGLFVLLVNFCVFKTKFVKLLEIRFFSPSLYYFGSWQTIRFGKWILPNCWSSKHKWLSGRAGPTQRPGVSCRAVPAPGRAITVPRAGGMAQGTARGPSGQLEGTAGHRFKVVPG